MHTIMLNIPERQEALCSLLLGLEVVVIGLVDFSLGSEVFWVQIWRHNWLRVGEKEVK